MEVHIIQEVEDGIPCEPEVYTSEKRATKRYLELVNKCLGMEFELVTDAYEEFWSDTNYGITDGYEIRYYITKTIGD